MAEIVLRIIYMIAVILIFHIQLVQIIIVKLEYWIFNYLLTQLCSFSDSDQGKCDFHLLYNFKYLKRS